MTAADTIRTDDPRRWLSEADACDRDGYDKTAEMLRAAAALAADYQAALDREAALKAEVERLTANRGCCLDESCAESRRADSLQAALEWSSRHAHVRGERHAECARAALGESAKT